MERSRSRAHAALGLVNAIGTGGLGAAAALDLWVEVEVWRCSSPRGYTVTRGERVEIHPAILESVSEAAAGLLGRSPGPVCARGSSDIPLEAGLKGSSALVNALLEAVLRLHGVSVGVEELARLGVEAARRAGLTVTGALDDHLAVSGCGGYATDNTRQAIVARMPRVSGYAAVVVPGRRSIRSIDPGSFAKYRRLYMAAWRLLESGDWLSAATVNGAATMLATGGEPGRLLGLLGEEGALAVGVSGKGPAAYIVAGSRGEAERLLEPLAAALGAGEALTARILPCPGGEAGPRP
ncbi:hypothetical protein CF15_06710 [Pyrodictium occultum]|uniref:Shikimate kinase n=1 Tax=Pyrodictium occultum TaxID=2309 RepID=A0A0V8RWK4_PYROC|nr:shikimate kinase [Pyrodictium occultum]KSW12413.1 hypothetical protein CF15_06710 [Pyrodictium occultum]